MTTMTTKRQRFRWLTDSQRVTWTAFAILAMFFLRQYADNHINPVMWSISLGQFHPVIRGHLPLVRCNRLRPVRSTQMILVGELTKILFELFGFKPEWTNPLPPLLWELYKIWISGLALLLWDFWFLTLWKCVNVKSHVMPLWSMERSGTDINLI